MEILKPKTVIMTFLVVLFTSGAAIADKLENGSHSLNSVVGVSSTSVRFYLDEGLATIWGDVDSGVESAIAQRKVLHLDGVDKVINRITVH